MARVNDAFTKLVSVVASVALVVGLMPLPAVALADDGAPDAENRNTATPLTVGTIATEETPLTIGAQSTEDAVQVNTWEGLQSAINAASNGKVIQLSGNVVMPSGKDRIKVDDKSVTIDLNGFTLNRNLTSVTDNGHVIEVFDGSTLTIADTSASGGGKITGGYSKYGGGIYVNKGATLNVQGGTITGNNAKEYGGGIYVKGTLNMAGGAVSRNWAGKQGGGIYARLESDSTLRGCSIDNNESDGHGGGIYMDAEGKVLAIANSHIDANKSGDDGGGFFLYWGTIAMNGGSLSGNEAANDSGGGKVTSQTTLTADGVLIKNNEAKSKEGGGIKNYGTATLKNCKVIGNSALKQGGGIFNDNDEYSDKSLGDLTLENCTISGNTSGHDGGGVYSDHRLTIIGGVIGKSTVDEAEVAGNYAVNRGNGVFIGKDSKSSAIQGSLKIEGNGTQEHGQDLFLRTGQKITVSGPLSAGARIGVAAEDGLGVFTSGYDANNSGVEPSTYFFSSEGVDIVRDATSNEAKIASSWNDLQAQIDDKPSGGTLVLAQDYTASSKNDRLKVTKSITIDLNGYTLNRNLQERAKNGHVIEVFDGATLTIRDGSDAQTGRITGGWPDRGGGIYVNENAGLVIKSGSITGNHSEKAGGGIYVLGSLAMTGGRIEGNQAGESGGGIFAGAEGSIDLKDAVIADNEAGDNGGGINVKSEGGSSIKDCTITGNHADDNGGGVHMSAEEKALAISGTTIDNNTAGEDGGGLSLESISKTVNMSGGSISNNTAGSGGGGVKVNVFSTFRATGVEIAGNEAENGEGGGVKTHGATVLENCPIVNNSATKQGGGVFNDNDKTSLGGFSIGEADLTIEGCTISGNISGHDGGGVYSSKKLAIVGGTIGQGALGGIDFVGNRSANRGGGIFIGKNATETSIKGGIAVKGNDASQGADLYLRSGKKLALAGAITGTEVGSIDMEKAGVFTDGYHTYHGGIAPKAFFGTAEEALPVVWSSDGKEARLKSFWPDLQAQINEAAENGTEVKLDQNYTAGSADDRLQIPENKSVTIDLNGYTLNRNLAQVTGDGHVFEVFENATLTIKDSSETEGSPGTGKITGGFSKWGGGFFVNAGATLNIQGGTIEGNSASEYGGGVYAKKGATVNIAGGVIARNKTGEDGGGICMNGTLTMTGGTIEGNTAGESGGGIYVSTDGTISMANARIVGNTSKESGGGINMHLKASSTTFRNCTITGNKSDGNGGGLRFDADGKALAIADTVIEGNSSGDDGGGIFLRNGAIEMTDSRIIGNIAANDSGGVKVEGGTVFNAYRTAISGNKATTKEGGGIKNFGTTTLVDCTITGNSAVNEGGGIFNNTYDDSKGELTLENCTISGNSSESNGGGVYSSSKLTIKGGIIGKSTLEGEEVPGNSAAAKGGGIFIGRDVTAVEIEGGIVVRDNSAATFGNDIYLRSGKKLTCTGELSASATMGVDLEDGAGILTKGYKDTNGTAIPAQRFIVAKGYYLGLKDGEVEIRSEWADLKSQIESASDGALIELTKDYAASASDDRIRIPEGRHITVDLKGKTLNRNRTGSDADGHVFEVFGTLTLQDTSASKAGTVTGGWANNGGGINIARSGTLNLLGGTITGNRAVDKGGGIYVHGALNMRGGAIEANEAGESGGGIGMDGGVAINLEAGTVAGNKAGTDGGGIAVGKNTAVGMRGSPIVWGNNAAISGSDIYLPSGAKLNMTGALAEEAQMGVALEGEWGTFTSGYSNYNNTDPAQYFTSTLGYAVYKEHGEAALGLSTYGETEYEKPFVDWSSQVNVNTDVLGGQNWMSGISGERYLNEINMPGTHDSGMKNIQDIEWYETDTTATLTTWLSLVGLWGWAAYGIGRKYATTQTTYIDQQLAEGARQFDIRLNDCKKELSDEFGSYLEYVWVDDGENLWLCHGTNPTTGCYLALDSSDHFLSFNKVLGWMKDFLEKHPTETIILNIRPETTQEGHGGKIYQRARTIMEKTLTATNPSTGEPYLYRESGSGSFFARYTHMPQLKDCRGKIVLLPNDSWALGTVGGFTKGMFVENFEFPTDYTLTAAEKIEEEPRAYNLLNPDGSVRIPVVAGSMTDSLWYWELNCTGEDQGDWDYITSGDSPVDLANIVNPALVGDGKLFGSQKDGQYIGWVRMDAFEAKYAEAIWRTNFFDSLEYCTVTVKSGLKDPDNPEQDDSNYPDQEYKVLRGTELSVPGNIYKQLGEGTYLNGWEAKGASAEVVCSPGETFTVDEDVVFTAQWLSEGETPVRIVWKDGEDADKLRPHSVVFDVTTVDGQTSQETTSQLTLTDEGRWSGAVEGAVSSIVPRLDWAQDAYQSTYKLVAGDGYVFTFTHTPSATKEVAGTVVWEDDDNAVGARPESVKIRLLADGTQVDSKTVTADGNWAYSFVGLPQYIDGEKVDYSIAEDGIADYDTTIDGFTVTNTYAPSGQDLVDVVGVVNWDDGDNRNGTRPESITVHLYANGAEVSTGEVEMSEFGLWVFSIDDLPIADDGQQPIAYTLGVDEIPGYDKPSVEPLGDYAFRVTNTLIVPPEDKKPIETVEAPVALNLTYNGEEQSLVKTGSASGGTMVYALSENGDYSSELPVGTNADNYPVWYYVKGDVFHTDTVPACVTATIGKRLATITVDDATKARGEEDPTFTGTVEGLVDDGDLGEVKYIRTNSDEAVGTYGGVLTATYTENPNYDVTVNKGDFTITASDSPFEYTVRWLDGDGNILQEKNYIEGERAPAYDGKEPTKRATTQYTYEFAGWDGGTVEGTTTTYRSLFTETVNKYKVTFIDYDGTTVLKEAVEYDYGTPAADIERPADPTREPNAQYTYTFAGWTPEVVAVTGDATYKATYTESPVPTPTEKGTLTFDLGGGTLDGKTGTITIVADVGDVIKLPGAPTREGYTFKFWRGSEYEAGADYEVKGDHAFTAEWEEDSGSKPASPKAGDPLAGTLAPIAALAAASALCLAFAGAALRKRCRAYSDKHARK